NIINEVGAALLPRSGLVHWSKADVSAKSTKLTVELVIYLKRKSTPQPACGRLQWFDTYWAFSPA
ncbi:MAG: hypothetical protein ACW7DY_20870, partial [Paraglaciecola chathamensis]